jgi:hypothetical protein
METKNCPKCSNKMYHNQGISKKTGKPYENWKCGTCKYVEWIVQQPPNIPKSTEPSILIIDEISGLRNETRKHFQDLNARMDGLARFLKEQLSGHE